MEIKIKKLTHNAVIPTYAHDSDAGMDLTAVSKTYDTCGNVVYGTGIAIAIPNGYVGLIFPRSSNSKKDLLLSNAVGVIDSGYRGEIMLKFKRSYLGFRSVYKEYEVGDRVGQIIIMPYPKIQFTEVDELDSTDRGNGGYGSTGA